MDVGRGGARHCGGWAAPPRPLRSAPVGLRQRARSGSLRLARSDRTDEPGRRATADHRLAQRHALPHERRLDSRLRVRGRLHGSGTDRVVRGQSRRGQPLGPPLHRHRHVARIPPGRPRGLGPCRGGSLAGRGLSRAVARRVGARRRGRAARFGCARGSARGPCCRLGGPRPPGGRGPPVGSATRLGSRRRRGREPRGVDSRARDHAGDERVQGQLGRLGLELGSRGGRGSTLRRTEFRARACTAVVTPRTEIGDVTRLASRCRAGMARADSRWADPPMIHGSEGPFANPPELAPGGPAQKRACLGDPAPRGRLQLQCRACGSPQSSAHSSQSASSHLPLRLATHMPSSFGSECPCRGPRLRIRGGAPFR